MPDKDDPFKALREALQLSPDNVPLRRHLAESLERHGLYEEAEDEFRVALKQAPGNVDLQIGLANCYYLEGKHSHALVVVEEMVKRRDTDARAYLLHSRLLFRDGDVSFAVSQYGAAIDADPDIADAEYEEMLGIDGPDDAEVVDGRIRAGWNAEPEVPQISVDRPKIDFADVGGMEQLKEEIRLKIIYPLSHPEMYEAYGKSIGGGILMYGPPGCGKTHLARATAGEIKSGFISVGISDVLDMWIGNSERNLHELFEQARRNRPCVLFFDEVDALGASRADMRQNAGRHLINQFLSELDGADASNDGVLILGATNAPWHLDSAFRRPTSGCS